MEKILILSNSKGYGGADKSLETLLKKIICDYQVHFVAENSLHCDEVRQIIANGNYQNSITQMSSSNFPLSILVNVFKLKIIFDQFNPSIILVNSNRAAIYLAIYKLIFFQKDIKTFLYIRGFDWKYTKIIFSILKNAFKLIPSEAVLDKKNYVAEITPLSSFRVLNNAIEVEACHKVTEEKVDTDKNTLPYIICFSNITRWKGLDYLIKAFALLEKNLQNAIKLKIFGSVFPNQQEYFQELKQLVLELNLDEKIEFNEFTKNTASLYENCLFLVNSSITEFGGPETFGRTIVEAWLYKKAVVSFDCGGPKYIIDNQINGLLVKEKSVYDMAQALTQLINDESLCSKMGMAGYIKAKQFFNQNKVYEDFKAIVLEKTY